MDLKVVTGVLQMRRAREDSNCFYAFPPRLNSVRVPENTLLPAQTLQLGQGNKANKSQQVISGAAVQRRKTENIRLFAMHMWELLRTALTTTLVSQSGSRRSQDPYRSSGRLALVPA